MKKWILYGFSIVCLLNGAAVRWSYANSSALPPIDKRIEKTPTEHLSFFVKYHRGTEHKVRELVRSYQLEVVDTLEDQQVLVILGSQEEVEKLSESEWVDYVEPNPIRNLYFQ